MDAISPLQLMLPSFVLCVLMVGMLSYLGIHVIKREIIFVDLALAQIAALGALMGLMLGIPLHTQASYLFSLALTAIAAAVFALSRARKARVPQEAIIGLAYAIAAATTIILIDKAPHGAEHIKDILTGSILWVKWSTVGKVAAVYAFAGLFHYVFRCQLLAATGNIQNAETTGLNVRLWDFLFYLSFGLVITVTVGTAGVLLVFVFLVAPAVLAVLISDRLRNQILVGWALGIAATVSGLIASYVGDLSSGPVVIGAYAVVIITVAMVIRVLRAGNRRRALWNTLAGTVVFGLALAALLATGKKVGAGFHSHGHAGLNRVADSGATSLDLDHQFALETDLDGQVAVVLRALVQDRAAGAELAIRFLEGNPPLFYGQRVVTVLDSLGTESTGFDVSEPPTTARNQAALARIRAEFGLPEEGSAGPP